MLGEWRQERNERVGGNYRYTESERESIGDAAQGD